MAHETKARSLRPWDSFHFFCSGADVQLLFDLSCLQASISPCLDCVRPGGRISERRFHLRCPEVCQGFQRPRGCGVSPANGRGFYRLPETRRGQAVNVGFGSIMIEQDLMEARHGKEQWKERTLWLDRRWNSKVKVWELFVVIGVLYVFKLKLHVYRNMTCISRLSVLTMVVYIHTCIDL